MGQTVSPTLIYFKNVGSCFAADNLVTNSEKSAAKLLLINHTVSLFNRLLLHIHFRCKCYRLYRTVTIVNS